MKLQRFGIWRCLFCESFERIVLDNPGIDPLSSLPNTVACSVLCSQYIVMIWNLTDFIVDLNRFLWELALCVDARFRLWLELLVSAMHGRLYRTGLGW